MGEYSPDFNGESFISNHNHLRIQLQGYQEGYGLARRILHPFQVKRRQKELNNAIGILCQHYQTQLVQFYDRPIEMNIIFFVSPEENNKSVDNLSQFIFDTLLQPIHINGKKYKIYNKKKQIQLSHSEIKVSHDGGRPFTTVNIFPVVLEIDIN